MAATKKSPHEAMFEMWHEFDNIGKNAKAHQYTYTDLAQLLTAIKPVMKSHGFYLVQTACDGAGNDLSEVTIETNLVYKDGTVLAQSMKTLPVVQGKDAGKTCQNYGIAATYARRYAILEILCLASEDNDGLLNSQKRKEPNQFDKLAQAKYSAANTSHKKALADLLRLNDLDVNKYGKEASEQINGYPFKEAVTNYVKDIHMQDLVWPGVDS